MDLSRERRRGGVAALRERHEVAAAPHRAATSAAAFAITPPRVCGLPLDGGFMCGRGRCSSARRPRSAPSFLDGRGSGRFPHAGLAARASRRSVNLSDRASAFATSEASARVGLACCDRSTRSICGRPLMTGLARRRALSITRFWRNGHLLQRAAPRRGRRARPRTRSNASTTAVHGLH